MPNTSHPRFILPYGHHRMFKLGHDSLIVDRGRFNGSEWYIIEIPSLGFVANFYADPHDGDSCSVDGYFDTLETARQYLWSVLDV